MASPPLLREGGRPTDKQRDTDIASACIRQHRAHEGKYTLCECQRNQNTEDPQRSRFCIRLKIDHNLINIRRKRIRAREPIKEREGERKTAKKERG